MADEHPLYRVAVHPTLTGNGLLVTESKARLVEVSHGKMALQKDLGMTSLDGWHETRASALLAAADRVRETIGVLQRQVERLTAEAAA